MIVILLVACGGTDETAVIDAASLPDDGVVIDGVLSGIDTPPSAMALSSAAFADGSAIPVVHTCDGANTSPPLTWSDAPTGTQSFAIVFRDKSIGLIHSVIYDIPAGLPGVPADVERVFAPSNVAGAHQSLTLGGASFGYTGPCPPAGTSHNYEFELFALDVATLPGAGMTTTQSQARTLILAHDLASTTLAGTFQH